MLSFAEWLIFAATGRVFIFLWFAFPLPPSFAKEINKRKYHVQVLNKLHECDLCAGVWIYSILALATGADMSGVNSVVTMIATGVVTSFLVHLFMIGVREKFQPPVII